MNTRPSDPFTNFGGQVLAGGAADSSYVNGVILVPAATGSGVQVQAFGDDTNIGITLVPKGSGTSKLTAAEGLLITKVVAFTENATSTTHTGTIAIPAGAWLHGVRVVNQALWGGGTATMKVGDTADDDGYFIGVDLKATDLLVGEVLDTHSSTLWGGKEGAYLVAASGRRGPTSTNFGEYYAAGSNITGIITVGTPAVTTGRTFMLVTYSVGTASAATAN